MRDPRPTIDASLTERAQRIVARVRSRAARLADRSPEAAPPDEELGKRCEDLARTFGLDARELDFVTTCAAFAIEPELGDVFAGLQPGRRPYPTETLVARLFDHGMRRVLAPESPLCRWSLVHQQEVGPGEPHALVIDPLIRDWLLDDHRLDVGLVGVATPAASHPPVGSWPVEPIAALVERTASAGGRIRICIGGVPGSGRRSLAAAVSAQLGAALLVIDCDQIADDAWPATFVRAHRQAFLDRCALAWTGEAAFRRTWPAIATPFPIQFALGDPGQVPELAAGVVDHAVAMPATRVDERLELWCARLPVVATWPAGDREALARIQVTPGQIAAAAVRAPTSMREVAALLRESSRHRLGELARRIECTFTRSDLVIAPALDRALSDFLFEAQERASFWDNPAAQRLFPEGRGLFALFCGGPGTGKTMAAQVIAAELSLDLFRISLSTVISKYVGETAKNLARILARAETMDAVLLFDEADALFSRRTDVKDAHDRYANMDTNYLLQAIEAYRGIAILASNKKANIDPAFMRRLRYVLDFPRPDAAQRLRLWQQLVAELAGAERAGALEPALRNLADMLDATGAQIKYAVLAGVFIARRLGVPLAGSHLVAGLERELIKEGRELSDRERERLVRES